MYAELLQTPHPIHSDKYLEHVPLLDTIDTEAIHSRLAESDDNDQFSAQVFREALGVAQLVSNSLVFRPNKDWVSDFTPEILQESQYTNCYGYTIVLSECLDEARIPHHIVYTNGHAFVMVSDFTSYAWMVDAGDLAMSGDMLRALPKTALSKVPQQISAHDRGSVKFWTEEYFAGVKPQTPIESVSSKIEWLSVAPSNKNYQFKTEQEFRADHTLWLSIYEPKRGREVIEEISRINHFVATGRFMEAYTKIKSIHGLHPNIDERSNRTEIRDIIIGLVASGCVDQAIETTDGVAAGFHQDLNPNITLQAWGADQTREIGAITGRVDILQRAVDLYRAVSASDNRKVLPKKIAKTERMIIAQKQIDEARSSKV